jgi:hypothetical protein
MVRAVDQVDETPQPCGSRPQAKEAIGPTKLTAMTGARVVVRPLTGSADRREVGPGSGGQPGPRRR